MGMLSGRYDPLHDQSASGEVLREKERAHTSLVWRGYLLGLIYVALAAFPPVSHVIWPPVGDSNLASLVPVVHAAGTAPAPKPAPLQSPSSSVPERNSVKEVREMRASGKSATDVRNAGYTLRDMLNAGFTVQQARGAGYLWPDFRLAGADPEELAAAGASVGEMAGAGYTASELRHAGYTPTELRAGDFSAKQLNDVGIPVEQLKTAGFSAGELLRIGLSVAELRRAGFTDQELVAAGASHSLLHRHDPPAQAESNSPIQMSLTLVNMDFNQLMANPTLLTATEATLKKAIARSSGSGVSADDVSLTLSAGSVVAHAEVHAPEGEADHVMDALGQTDQLAQTVADDVARIPNIAGVLTGDLQVTGVTQPEQVPPTEQHKSQEGEKEMPGWAQTLHDESVAAKPAAATAPVVAVSTTGLVNHALKPSAGPLEVTTMMMTTPATTTTTTRFARLTLPPSPTTMPTTPTTPTTVQVTQPAAATPAPVAGSASLPRIYDCTPTDTVPESAWPADKAAWCCQHTKSFGCTRGRRLHSSRELHLMGSQLRGGGESHNCILDYTQRATKWSAAKKAWCCETAGWGCELTTPGPSVMHQAAGPPASPAASPETARYVTLSMTVRHVEYQHLVSDANLRDEFELAVKEAVASEAGHGTVPADVAVVLSAGSVVAHCRVEAPAGRTADVMDALAQTQQLGHKVATRLALVHGFLRISTGPIDVADITSPQATNDGQLTLLAPSHDHSTHHHGGFSVRAYSTWDLVLPLGLVGLMKILTFDWYRPASMRTGMAGCVERALAFLNMAVPLALGMGLVFRYQTHFSDEPLEPVEIRSNNLILTPGGRMPPVGTMCLEFESRSELSAAAELYFGWFNIFLFSAGCLCLSAAELMRLRRLSRCPLYSLCGLQDFTDWRVLRGFDSYPSANAATKQFYSVSKSKEECLSEGYDGFVATRDKVYFRSKPANDLLNAAIISSDSSHGWLTSRGRATSESYTELYVIPEPKRATLYSRLVTYGLLRLPSALCDTPESPFVKSLAHHARAFRRNFQSESQAMRELDKVSVEPVGQSEAYRLVFQSDLNEVAWALVLQALALTLWMPLDFITVDPCLRFTNDYSPRLVLGLLRFTSGDQYLWCLYYAFFGFLALTVAAAICRGIPCSRLYRSGPSIIMQGEGYVVLGNQSRLRNTIFWLFAVYSLAFGSINTATSIGLASSAGIVARLNNLYHSAHMPEAYRNSAAGAVVGIVTGAWGKMFARASGIQPMDERQLLLLWYFLQAVVRKVVVVLHHRLCFFLARPWVRELDSIVFEAKDMTLRHLRDSIPNFGVQERINTFIAWEWRKLLSSPNQVQADPNLDKILNWIGAVHNNGVRRAFGFQRILRDTIAASLALAPLVLLVPFGFDEHNWFHSQVDNWTFRDSIAEWVALAVARDVFVWLALTWASVVQPVAALWRGRVWCLAFLVAAYGAVKMSMSWEHGTFNEVFVPMAVLEVAKLGLIAVLLYASTAVENGLPRPTGLARKHAWNVVFQGELGQVGKAQVSPCTNCGRSLQELGGWQDDRGVCRLCADCVMEVAGQTFPPEADGLEDIWRDRDCMTPLGQ